MNLIGRRGVPAADFVVTGHWSTRSHKEAGRYGDARIAASSGQAAEIGGREQRPFTWVPPAASWQVRPEAAYLHLCSNETIGGVEFTDWPDLAELGAPDVPLVVDASSHFLSRPLDVTRTGLLFAGAQKNAGPAGVTVVIARRDLLGKALSICPSAFDYANVAAEHSRYNTPPTFSIYVAGLVYKWVKAQGGVQGLEAANKAKAELLYGYLDASGFYRNPVRAFGALAHERALRAARRIAQRRLLARRRGRRPARAQGAQERGWHARLHLQRHAAGRRAGPGRLPQGIRAPLWMIPCRPSCGRCATASMP